jgi:peptidoglycan L-alanyl-D-glutamate endopeptidase CwlK
MTTTLTARDLDRLKGVKAPLVAIVHEVAKDPLAPRFMVIEGLRSPQRQKELVAKGASRTLNSKHITGHAVDLAPLPLDWNNIAAFKELKKAMMRAGKKLGVRVRSGADWDENGVIDAEELTAYVKKFGRRPLVDWPHYEL